MDALLRSAVGESGDRIQHTLPMSSDPLSFSCLLVQKGGYPDPGEIVYGPTSFRLAKDLYGKPSVTEGETGTLSLSLECGAHIRKIQQACIHFAWCYLLVIYVGSICIYTACVCSQRKMTSN